MAGLTNEATGLIKEMLNADGGLPTYNVRRRAGGQGRDGGAAGRAAQTQRQQRRARVRARCAAHARVPPCPPQEDLVTRTLNVTAEYSAALGNIMRCAGRPGGLRARARAHAPAPARARRRTSPRAAPAPTCPPR